MSILSVSCDYLGSLWEEAVRSPRRRQHKNLHRSYEDPCQRLLNAIGMGSYIRPHRHSIDPKEETLIAIRGRFALLTFGENGEIQDVIEFASEKYFEASGSGAGVQLSPSVWHTVIALENESVLLELKAGPFNPCAAKEAAPWAPEEGSPEAATYLEWLRARV